MKQEYNLGFGAIESPKDPKQWELGSVSAQELYPVSCFIDTKYMMARMQSKQGCCVACTFEEIFAHIVYLSTGILHQPDTDNELSFRFLFALTKSLEGKPGWEMYPPAFDGAYPLMVMKVLNKYGICLAKYCPNDVSLDMESFMYHRNINNIPKEALEDAKARQIELSWFTVPNTQDGIKKAVNYAKDNKGGVAILRSVGDTYWKDVNGNSTWDKNKILPIRVPSQVTSGHEEMLTGYVTITDEDYALLDKKQISIENILKKYNAIS